MIMQTQPESPADLSSENLLVCSLHAEYIYMDTLKSTRDCMRTFQYYYIIMDYYF